MRIYPSLGQGIGKELVLGEVLGTGQRIGQNYGNLGQGPEKTK